MLVKFTPNTFNDYLKDLKMLSNKYKLLLNKTLGQFNSILEFFCTFDNNVEIEFTQFNSNNEDYEYECSIEYLGNFRLSLLEDQCILAHYQTGKSIWLTNINKSKNKKLLNDFLADVYISGNWNGTQQDKDNISQLIKANNLELAIELNKGLNEKEN